MDSFSGIAEVLFSGIGTQILVYIITAVSGIGAVGYLVRRLSIRSSQKQIVSGGDGYQANGSIHIIKDPKMINDQNQIVDGGDGYQSKDTMTINNHGTSSDQLTQIIHNLYNLNMPAMQEAAAQTAFNRMSKFIDKITKRIEAIEGEIDPSKFSEPNVQYHLQAASIEAAKRGEKSNTTMLADMLVELLRKNNLDMYDLAITQALSVSSKITSRHVIYLVMMDLSTTLVFKDLRITEVDRVVGQALSGFPDESDMNRTDFEYLVSEGVLQRIDIQRTGQIPSIVGNCSPAQGRNFEQFHDIVKKAELKNLDLLMQRTENWSFVPTLSGRMISAFSLKNSNEFDPRTLF